MDKKVYVAICICGWKNSNRRYTTIKEAKAVLRKHTNKFNWSPIRAAHHVGGVNKWY